MEKRFFGKTTERTILPSKIRTPVAFKLDLDYEKIFTKKGKQKVGFNPVLDIDKIKVGYKTIGSKYLYQENVLLWPEDRKGLAKKRPHAKNP